MTKESDFIEEHGILESGFNPRHLAREVREVGFSNAYLRLDPYFHYAYRTPNPMRRMGLKLRGLALDFAVNFSMPWYLAWALARGSANFKLTAQK